MLHSTALRIIQTFIESNDLTEKNVYLFCTSGSSGNDKSLRNLQPPIPVYQFCRRKHRRMAGRSCLSAPLFRIT